MSVVIAALMRHGDYRQPKGVPSALLPHPLTELGRGQAQKAGRELAERARAEGFDVHPVIDTSPLQRAWQTGRLVAEELGEALGGTFDVEEFPALAERSMGAMANLSVAQIEAILAEDPRYERPPEGWKGTSHFRLPFMGAESLYEAGERVAAHVRERVAALAGSGRGDRPLLKLFVGHGGAIRHGAHHLGVLDLDRIPGLSMYHCSTVSLESADGREFRHVAGQWKIRKPHTAQLDLD